VGVIPDSLISEYKTKNGRLVYDGGGIQPDYEVIPEKLSEITLQLYAQNMIFDYATMYRCTNEEIGTPGSFTISDDEYDSFKSYIEEQDFEFQTASEKLFEELKNTAKREKYFELADNEFSSLEHKLSHNNLKDLETFQDEIRQLLTEEIVNRYYYHAGRILAQIQDDRQLDKAVEILKEPALVKEVLEGNKGDLAFAASNR
jgi:carboxyl-terminal processing protease